VQKILNEIQKKKSNREIEGDGLRGTQGEKRTGKTTKEDERDSSVYIEKCH